jgi:iron complex outermembrane recepter protein
MRGVSAGQVVRDQPGVKEQVGAYLDDSIISLSLFTPDIDMEIRDLQATVTAGSCSSRVTNQPRTFGITARFNY